MATIVKTPSGTWKALIRKTGWPATAKTFRTKRDAEDWARRTEDEMVHGVYIQRRPSERMTIEDALKRYLSEVSPTKRPASADSDARHAKPLMQNLGKYSLAALTPELIAKDTSRRHRRALPLGAQQRLCRGDEWTHPGGQGESARLWYGQAPAHRLLPDLLEASSSAPEPMAPPGSAGPGVKLIHTKRERGPLALRSEL